MNRKPSWGLWLLMIVAPVAVFGGIRLWQRPLATTTALATVPTIPQLDVEAAKYAAKGQPFIGAVYFGTDPTQPNVTFPGVFICNPAREKFMVNAVVLSGKEEFVTKGMSGWGLSGGNGIVRFSLYDIKKVRKKDIRIRLYWQRGKKRGFKDVIITPQMNASNTSSGLIGAK